MSSRVRSQSTERSSRRNRDASSVSFKDDMDLMSGTKSILLANEETNINYDKEEENIPFINQVHELIEKEKLLLSLQLLDKEQQANQWKQKFDSLIDTVTYKSPHGTFAKINESELMQYVASVHHGSTSDAIKDLSEEPRIPFDEIKDSSSITRAFIMSRIDVKTKTLSLSNIPLNSNSALQIINKIIRQSRQKQEIQALLMSRCELDDSCTSLLDVISHNNLRVIDLSFNYLSISFQKALLQIFQNFRKTPEFVYLQGNAALQTASEGSKTQTSDMTAKYAKLPISTFVNSFTEATVGISLTLPDFDMNAMPKNPKAENLYDTSMNVMLCHKFLQHLNSTLTPHSAESSASRRKSAAKSDTLLSRRGGLRLLNALALTQSQMSKLSIEELRKTLHLTMSTLTDLDLSFSFIGCQGAIALGEVLEHRSSKLIRLGLAGNALGDLGFEKIIHSLQSNNSLTYLDCRSNAIGDKGVRQLARIMSHETNKILQFIKLQQNDISFEAIYDTETVLADHGCLFQIQYNSNVSVHRAVKTRLPPSNALPLYEFPHRIVKPINRVGEALLYSVSVNTLYTISSSSIVGNDPFILHFQWKWRPCGMSEDIYSPHIDESKHHAATSASGPGQRNACLSLMNNEEIIKEFDEHFAWEIRFVSSRGEIIHSQAQYINILSQSSCYSSNIRSLARFDWFDVCTSIYINSSIISQEVIHLPSQGSIEIAAINTKYYQMKRSQSHIESIDLIVSATSMDTSLVLSKDSEVGMDIDRHGIIRELLSAEPQLQEILSQSVLLPGYDVIRCHRWTHSTTVSRSGYLSNSSYREWNQGTCTVSFDLKLHIDTSNRSEDENQMDLSQVGYSWAIWIVSIIGTARQASEGSCSSSSSEQERDLRPWIWAHVDVPLDNLVSGDYIVVIARSITPKLGDAMASILCKSFEIKCNPNQFVKSYTLQDDQNQDTDQIIWSHGMDPYSWHGETDLSELCVYNGAFSPVL